MSLDPATMFKYLEIDSRRANSTRTLNACASGMLTQSLISNVRL